MQRVGLHVRQREVRLDNVVHAVEPQRITVHRRIAAGKFEVRVRPRVKNALVERLVVSRIVISRVAAAQLGGEVQESHDFMGSGKFVECVEPAVSVRHEHAGPVVVGRASRVQAVHQVP